MAERNAGPVKPPTIDLVAREAPPPPPPAGGPDAAAEQPSASQASPARRSRSRKARPDAPAPMETPGPASPPPPEPAPPPPSSAAPARPQPDWAQIGAAAVIGALFGTALTYAIATVLPLPAQAPAYEDPAPALTDQAARLGMLEQRLGVIEESAADTQISLDATVAQIDAGFTDVRQQIASVKDSIPPQVPVDVTAINDRLRALSARIDAIAAGASSADAGALAENLSDIEAALAAVRQELAGVDRKAEAAAAELASLRAAVATLEERAAAPLVPPGPSIGEVALNGLEAAFAAGRPYADELEALSRAAPEAAVPPAIAGAAETGLPSPEAIGDRFASLVPEMLAAQRPADGEGWQETALDWLRGLLAIRPAGDVAGDTPEAILARLEATMARRDYVAADALFARLPEEMRNAAGAVPGQVRLQADAARWIATLRGSATGAAQ